MPEPVSSYQQLKEKLDARKVALVAVSKIQPIERIMELYSKGQRAFGENYVQELVDKSGRLPEDIQWHFIGHLQTNKVKFIIPVVTMIQGVDSFKLLKEVNKQAEKSGRVVDCLLQVHIAAEETKFGFDDAELRDLLDGPGPALLKAVNLRGLMGMASFSDDRQLVTHEFEKLRKLFDEYQGLFRKNGEPVLSMGMSGDYEIAIDQGSNMVRLGSLLFGARPAKSPDL